MRAANVRAMKTLWNGVLELGEVAVPVGIAATVRDGGEKLRRLHEACATPVSLRSYCGRDEQLLDDGDVVQAYEVAPGEYLVLTPDETAALKPAESRSMPVQLFVDAVDLDALLVRKHYRLVPSKSSIGRRAYAVLAEAMYELGAVAIVRFTAWQSEQLAAVASGDGILLGLVTMHFAEDLVPDGELLDELLADQDDPAAAEVDLARRLIARHTRRLKPADLASLERPRVRELLEAKLAGQPIVRPEPASRTEPSVVAGGDLAGALERSLKKAPRGRRRAAAAAR